MAYCFDVIWDDVYKSDNIIGVRATHRNPGFLVVEPTKNPVNPEIFHTKHLTFPCPLRRFTEFTSQKMHRNIGFLLFPMRSGQRHVLLIHFKIWVDDRRRKQNLQTGGLNPLDVWTA